MSNLYLLFTFKGGSMNNKNYNELLRAWKVKIKSKMHGKVSKVIILYQNNTRPHTAYRTICRFKDLGYELLDHPLYSVDLALRDFNFFGPFKEGL